MRTLQSMQGQTIDHWICDVYDNDPEHSARDVVQSLGDARIRWTPNPVSLPPAANIDRCYTRENSHDAEWFCSVEDDDYISPTFVQENIELAEVSGARIVLRNQIIELDSGTPEARLSEYGVLDQRFREGLTPPTLLRLALLADLSVSNGGLFWSRHAVSDLELKFICNPVLQEYLRTLTIVEPIYVALRPLAVWAKKGAKTSRYQGDPAGYFRRELNLKRSLQKIRQDIWQHATPEERATYLSGSELLIDPTTRAQQLVKALIGRRISGLSVWEKLELTARGLLIRSLGRTTADFEAFVRGSQHGREGVGAGP